MSKETLLAHLDIAAFYRALVPSLNVNGKVEAAGVCPFHDDHSPSLSVNIESGLFNCFSCNAGGDVFKFYMDLKKVNFPTALREIAVMQGIEEVKSRVVATFNYKDENGKILYRKERVEPGKNGKPGSKDFFFSHPKDGQWIKGRGCGDSFPYNIPFLLKSKNTFVVEGEGKADLLTSWGLAATCLDSGSRSPWRPEYLGYFKGKEKVVILPDNDPTGREYALRIAEVLHGHVGEIKIVPLPDLQEKGDVIDWARREGNDKTRLLEIVKQAPAWTPGNVETPGVIKLETVTPEVVTWLWQGRIPLGKITLLDGDPGLGKSTVTLDIAMRVSTGSPMPDGTQRVSGGVVILSLEDGLADTIVPRLKAVGADLSRIVALQSVTGEDGKSRFPTIENVEAIARACRDIQARLVIVDPLMGYLNGKTNSWRDQDVRQALGPIARMADEIGVAVLVVRHLNKSGGNQSIYRGGGSIGIIGAARSALLVAKDPQDENRRVLAGIKNNLAPMPESLAFRIEGVDRTSKIAWEGVSSHTADQLLAVPVSQEERSALEEAQDFLRDILSDGSVDSKEILNQARKAGIPEKTLHRAKKVIGVQSRRSGFGKGGSWVWSLIDGQKSPYMVNKNNDHLCSDLTIYGKGTLPILEVD